MNGRDRLAGLVELYALDALESHELVDFETHLEICDLCQVRLSEARTVTAAFVADTDPPNPVWDRIVAEIERAENPEGS